MTLCKVIARWGLWSLIRDSFRSPDSLVFEPADRALDRHLFVGIVRQRYQKCFVARWAEDVCRWAWYKMQFLTNQASLRRVEKENEQLKRYVYWYRSQYDRLDKDSEAARRELGKIRFG